MPTSEQLFHIVFSLVMGMVSTIFILWTRHLNLEKSNLLQQIEVLRAQHERDMKDVRDDMQALSLHVDKGTSRCSERTGAIQEGIGRLTDRMTRLPEDLRTVFISKAEVDLLVSESRRDREALWREVRRGNGSTK